MGFAVFPDKNTGIRTQVPGAPGQSSFLVIQMDDKMKDLEKAVRLCDVAIGLLIFIAVLDIVWLFIR